MSGTGEGSFSPSEPPHTISSETQLVCFARRTFGSAGFRGKRKISIRGLAAPFQPRPGNVPKIKIKCKGVYYVSTGINIYVSLKLIALYIWYGDIFTT